MCVCVCVCERESQVDEWRGLFVVCRACLYETAAHLQWMIPVMLRMEDQISFKCLMLGVSKIFKCF